MHLICVCVCILCICVCLFIHLMCVCVCVCVFMYAFDVCVFMYACSVHVFQHTLLSMCMHSCLPSAKPTRTSHGKLPSVDYSLPCRWAASWVFSVLQPGVSVIQRDPDTTRHCGATRWLPCGQAEHASPQGLQGNVVWPRALHWILNNNDKEDFYSAPSYLGSKIYTRTLSSLLQNFCISQLLQGFFFWPRKVRCMDWYCPCFFFIGYPENAKCPPDKNCVSCSRHKISQKLAYLSVKMMLLIQEHKFVRKVADLSVWELHISFKGIGLSGKFPISVYQNCISRSKV